MDTDGSPGVNSPRIRLVGAVVNLALVVDTGTGDLEPVQVNPVNLNAKQFREFAGRPLEEAIDGLEKDLLENNSIEKSI